MGRQHCVCGGKGGRSAAGFQWQGQVSFLPPDSTITCPFSEEIGLLCGCISFLSL